MEKFIPLSNWEKFFRKIVAVEGDYLKKRWHELYGLRCNIAHSIGISASDYNRICTLYKELSEPLEQTIRELDKVTVDNESKELLAENIVINKAEQVGQFLLKFKKLEDSITKYLYANNLKSNQPISFIDAIEILKQKSLLNESLYKDLRNIRYLRNKIVHQTDDFDEQVIQNLKDGCNKISELADMIDKIGEKGVV